MVPTQDHKKPSKTPIFRAFQGFSALILFYRLTAITYSSALRLLHCPCSAKCPWSYVFYWLFFDFWTFHMLSSHLHPPISLLGDIHFSNIYMYFSFWFWFGGLSKIIWGIFSSPQFYSFIFIFQPKRFDKLYFFIFINLISYSIHIPCFYKSLVLTKYSFLPILLI